ncbi:hypothetical protein Q9L58_010524 [Maublancomyces gigas]|uniref:Uncharacterized protein n=1 Tax=Discina gigas TaxID=1032678 RepID=A0ABR3G3X4_9PEZI
MSATGGIALRPWPISAWTTYQTLRSKSLKPNSQPPTPSGAYGTPISNIPTSSPFSSWKATLPAPPAMPLFTEKEINAQWTPTAGPHNRPLGDGFNASMASIAAHDTAKTPQPNTEEAVIEVESSAPTAEEFVPETQVPTGTPETNVDMKDTQQDLEIIQEHPANAEAPDNEAFMAPPPGEPHAYSPDKYDYLHLVPEDSETSSFLAYMIADNSMCAHNSTMGPIMAIGKMVEALCGSVRTLTSEVTILRAEVKLLRKPTALPAQTQQ